MKILFMGTPDFARESLKSLYEENHTILEVVTNPDKPKGRGMKMVMSPVKEYAIQKGIFVEQPEKIKNNPEFVNHIKSLNPDVICVVAYGKILPKEILEIPQYGCVNVHASLLPKYRGAAPIQWAILNGDSLTGVTTMYMDEGMDTGDILLSKETKIGEEETTGELWERLAKMGGKLLVETLKQMEEGKEKRTKQVGEFSLAPMLKKEMAKIEWKEKTAKEIHNLVRGLNPIMGAYTFYEEKKIKLWKVKVIDEKQYDALFPESPKVEEQIEGTILLADEKKGLWIKAKEGILQVEEIQAENAKKMKIEDFLRGNKIVVGERLK